MKTLALRAIFFSNSKKIISLLLVLLFLTACAHRAPFPVESPKPEAVWQDILLQGNTQARAFEVSFSLVSSAPETKKYRLAGQLWGNTKGPVRLDLRASIGTLVAIIAERNDNWLFYNALQQTACKGPMRSLSRELTIALPFSLKTLGAVMLGSIKELLPPIYQKATVARDGTVLYHFKKETGVQTLKVSADGLPMELETDTWQMSWPGWKTGEVPPRLHFKDTRASISLFTKKHTFYNSEHPDSEIEFQLPPDIQVLHR